MKKLIIFTVFSLFSFGSIFAQADSDVVQLGVRGGANFATVTGDDFDDPDSRTSFYAGFVAEVPYSERFSLQAEVYYSGQGFDIKNNGDGLFDTSGDVEYQLDYIQIPLMAKIYLIDGLSVQAGPQIGFLINEEIDYKPNSDGGDTDIPEGLSQTNDIDFSLVAGAEYKFDGGFFVQARYNYGFSEIIENADVHNSYFQAGVGFMF
jgi:hypothetical protein